jgi:hypothetical protein
VAQQADIAHPAIPVDSRKAPEHRVVREARHKAREPVIVARIATAEHATSTQNDLIRCDSPQRAQNNIQEAHFWQEKNLPA